jgi:hypothetical protein
MLNKSKTLSSLALALGVVLSTSLLPVSKVNAETIKTADKM